MLEEYTILTERAQNNKIWYQNNITSSCDDNLCYVMLDLSAPRQDLESIFFLYFMSCGISHDGSVEQSSVSGSVNHLRY